LRPFGPEAHDGQVAALRARVQALAQHVQLPARRLLAENERLLRLLREQLEALQTEHDGVSQHLPAL
jgi:hypothetical protein